MQGDYTPSPSPDAPSNGVHPSEPAGQRQRHRDHRIMDWCENTGPWLPFKHRAVLKLIGEFADPSDGDAWPAQETMARILGTSRQTVNKICNELEALEVFTAAEQDTRSGRWSCNRYHLAGFESGWAGVVPQGEKPYLLMNPVERQMFDLAQKLANAVQLLEDNGLDTSAFIIEPDTEDSLYRVKFENGHGDEEDPEVVPMAAYIEGAERVDLGETSLDDLAKDLENAWHDEIRQFVDAHAERLLKPKGPFDHRGGVMRTFRENPKAFEDWKGKLAPKEPERGKYRRDYERYRGLKE